VLVGDPLVTKVLAELVDLLDPADDQALQVELRRDSQIEVAIERVVVGGEGPGQRPSVQRLEDRSLDLHEVTRIEPAADLGDRAGPLQEELAGLLVRHQVELPPPVAGLNVLEAVEFLGRRPKALGEQLPRVGSDRELAALGGEDRPLDPDDVPDVEGKQALVGVAELVDSRLHLDLAGAVLQVQEGGLAVPAPRRQPAGDPIAVAGLLARPDPLVRLTDRRDLGPGGEAVGERLNPRFAQALELRPPVGE
jgi:hypothetical protein